MIPFNKAPITGREIKYIKKAINKHQIGGDSIYSKKCMSWMEENFKVPKVLLTTSCTTALDMAVMLCDIKEGDEVILPSYTFSSSATSIVMRGGIPVFVDVRPDTMNIDEMLIENAITSKTKAIMVMHYAGVACEMDKIMNVAKKYNLMVIEDAAQAFNAYYKGKPLGTIGDFGCFSFHETKNISMGEGGAIVIRNDSFIEKAEILREKGTNRSKFYRGQVDKYTWVGRGGSYLASDILAAYLWGQLQEVDNIYSDRMNSWEVYRDNLNYLVMGKCIDVQVVPEYCQHNAHIFYIKCRDVDERDKFIKYMKTKNIVCSFHYIPLHSSPAGKQYGYFHGEDVYTTKESERLVRLPLYYGMKVEDLNWIIESTKDFFKRF